jgi:hypothetical protein
MRYGIVVFLNLVYTLCLLNIEHQRVKMQENLVSHYMTIIASNQFPWRSLNVVIHKSYANVSTKRKFEVYSTNLTHTESVRSNKFFVTK